MRIPISEARARLPELAQRAMDAPGEVIIIEHRDRKERVVLVAESHLRMLETQLAALRTQAGSAPFRLVGSIETDLSAAELDAAIAENRARQQTLAEGKLQRALED